MDFPLNLDMVTNSYLEGFVQGYAELRQTLILILKQTRYHWVQSPAVGGMVKMHQTNDEDLQYSIIASLEEVRGVRVQSCKKVGDEIVIRISYFNSLAEFEFNVNEIL